MQLVVLDNLDQYIQYSALNYTLYHELIISPWHDKLDFKD